MVEAQTSKKIALDPTAATANSTTTLTIDCATFDYCTIDVQLGHVSNASNVPTVIQLAESDVTNASTFVNITGASHTSNVTALPTTGCTICTWDVSTIARKRFLQASVSPQAAEVLAIVANLSRAEQSPTTATAKNVAAWIVL